MHSTLMSFNKPTLQPPQRTSESNTATSDVDPTNSLRNRRQKLIGANNSKLKEVSAKQSAASNGPEVHIIVMGGTGTGKTSFINLASSSQLQVGTELHSCTEDVQFSQPFYIGGRFVRLIDTPGFDDSSKSDADILKSITTFLSNEYKDRRKLSGIIYTHRISDVRMGGVSRRNFSMFQRICGTYALKNVVLATTMWDDVGATLGIVREEELKSKDNFFKPVLDAGARIMRHDHGANSAQTIVRSLVDNEPRALLVQTEIVDEGKDISETAAGMELRKDIMERAEKNEKERQTLIEEMKTLTAADKDSQKELEEECQSLQDAIARLQEEANKLSGGLPSDNRPSTLVLGGNAFSIGAKDVEAGKAILGERFFNGNVDLPEDRNINDALKKIVEDVRAEFQDELTKIAQELQEAHEKDREMSRTQLEDYRLRLDGIEERLQVRGQAWGWLGVAFNIMNGTANVVWRYSLGRFVPDEA